MTTPPEDAYSNSNFISVISRGKLPVILFFHVML